jgi:hypothetical protein
MKKLLDANDPFFVPVWRRWATAIAPMLWALFELLAFGSPGWAILFAAVGGYAFWILIVKGPDQP